jgi:hypothetical protein
MGAEQMMGFAEFIIGRAFGRPVGSTHPARSEHIVARIVVIGNAAGGKSTLARHLARRRELPLIEADRLLWQQGWQLTPEPDYARGHAEIVAGDRWVIDGLGRQDSIAERLASSTEIILIDMPLWMHFWLAAERQIAWARGRLDNPPAGAAEMPPTPEPVQDDGGGRSSLAARHSQHVRGGGAGGQSG